MFSNHVFDRIELPKWRPPTAAKDRNFTSHLEKPVQQRVTASDVVSKHAVTA